MRPMPQELRATMDPVQVLLARNIALFTVAFSTTKRGDELTRTLIQRVLRLPNRSGFMFNFQWGETMRDGADHLITIPLEEGNLATCPIRAVGPWIAVGTNAGWDMTQGYLFPHITAGADRVPVRGSLFLTAPQMTFLLNQHSVAARENQDFSMHSFRSGRAVSRACAGEDVSTIMQSAFWKSPKTAWRYMRLAEVLPPATTGHTKVPGITDEQYRQINEFPLKEHSKSWAAFGNAPMVE